MAIETTTMTDTTSDPIQQAITPNNSSISGAQGSNNLQTNPNMQEAMSAPVAASTNQPKTEQQQVAAPLAATMQMAAPQQTVAPTMSAAMQQPSYQTVDQAYNQLVNQNSPMMQQAKAVAARQAAQRGLGNSSMAIGAAQAAQAEAAIPMAQQMASQSQQQGQYERSQTEQERAAQAGENLQQQALEEQKRAAQVGEGQAQQQITNQQQQYQSSLQQQQAEFAQNMALENAKLQEQSQQFAQSIQANSRGAYTDAVNNLINNSSVNINNIASNANIPQDQKNAMIQQELSNRNNDLAYLQTLYGSVNSWADRL